jgi:hypothetical protein
MNGATANRARPGRLGVWRIAATWALLFAFALQSYITQTHIHGVSAAIGPAASGQVFDTTFAQAPAHGEDEAIACPFCQAAAAAGAFFTPPPVQIATSRVQTLAAHVPFERNQASVTASFAWRSRAPPQA